MRLCSLYPYDYKVRFSAEMRAAFTESLADQRSDTRRAVAGFVLWEIGALMIGALKEWVAKLTSSPSLRGRSLPDLRMMRPPEITRELWFAGIFATDTLSAEASELKAVERRTQFCVQQLMQAIARRDFEVARDYSYQERIERAKLVMLRDSNAGG